MSSPRTFLVVEDSRLHHQIYNLVFSRPAFAGSRVLHAMDGREGYATFVGSSQLTAVILDVNMPVMNGIEFLEKRRAERIHPDVPVILVTSGTSSEEEARAREAGAVALLHKPFRPEELEALLARVLGANADRSDG